MKTPMSIAGKLIPGSPCWSFCGALLMALPCPWFSARQRDSLTLNDFGMSLGGYLQWRAARLTEAVRSLLDREQRVVSCSLSRTLPHLRAHVITDNLHEPTPTRSSWSGPWTARRGRLILRYKEYSAVIEMDPLLGETYRFEDSRMPMLPGEIRFFEYQPASVVFRRALEHGSSGQPS